MDHRASPPYRGQPAPQVLPDTCPFKLCVPGSLYNLRVINRSQYLLRDLLTLSHIDHGYLLIVKSVSKQQDMKISLHVPVQTAFTQVHIGVGLQINGQCSCFSLFFQTLITAVNHLCKEGGQASPSSQKIIEFITLS